MFILVIPEFVDNNLYGFQRIGDITGPDATFELLEFATQGGIGAAGRIAWGIAGGSRFGHAAIEIAGCKLGNDKLYSGILADLLGVIGNETVIAGHMDLHFHWIIIIKNLRTRIFWLLLAVPHFPSPESQTL